MTVATFVIGLNKLGVLSWAQRPFSLVHSICGEDIMFLP